MDLSGTVAPHDLCEAAEDYELAASRFAWARACGCQLIGDQLAAIAWLGRQCEESLAVMEGFAAS